jgi:membrane protease YdiL (CAAX protease family)
MSTFEYGTAPAPIFPAPAPQLPTKMPVDRRQRLAGLLIVLCVAVLPLIFTSLLTVIGVKPDSSEVYLRYRYIHSLLMQATSLALLAYVVGQNRQSWADFGLVFRLRDLVYGMLLWVAAVCSYSLVSPSVLSFSEQLGWHRTAAYVPSLKLGGALALCYLTMSPIFEEMIVRAFLMTETVALTGSSALAIFVGAAPNFLSPLSRHPVRVVRRCNFPDFTMLVGSES